MDEDFFINCSRVLGLSLKYWCHELLIIASFAKLSLTICLPT